MAQGGGHFLCFAVILLLTILADVSAQSCSESWYLHDGNCYAFGQQRITWGDAEETCKMFGGKLAEVDTPEESKYLKLMARLKHLDRTWIGGTDILGEGKWEWVSSGQVILAYTDWHAGQPDDADDGRYIGEDCLHINAAMDYEWDDWACHKLAYFICEAPLSSQGGGVIG